MEEANMNCMKHRSERAQVIPVIEVKTVIGKGTEKDPVRCIREYWSLSGELLAVRQMD